MTINNTIRDHEVDLHTMKSFMKSLGFTEQVGALNSYTHYLFNNLRHPEAS